MEACHRQSREDVSRKESAAQRPLYELEVETKTDLRPEHLSYGLGSNLVYHNSSRSAIKMDGCRLTETVDTAAKRIAWHSVVQTL